MEAALAYAMAGETARAESLAQDLNRAFPLDTQMQSLWLPAIRAELALNRKNPAEALNALQAAAPPIELGKYPVCRQSFLPLSNLHSRRGLSGRRDRARKPPPSSRRFSTTAASSGTAGREPWRIWAWLVPMLSK